MSLYKLESLINEHQDSTRSKLSLQGTLGEKGGGFSPSHTWIQHCSEHQPELSAEKFWKGGSKQEKMRQRWLFMGRSYQWGPDNGHKLNIQDPEQNTEKSVTI